MTGRKRVGAGLRRVQTGTEREGAGSGMWAEQRGGLVVRARSIEDGDEIFCNFVHHKKILNFVHPECVPLSSNVLRCP